MVGHGIGCVIVVGFMVGFCYWACNCVYNWDWVDNASRLVSTDMGTCSAVG